MRPTMTTMTVTLLLTAFWNFKKIAANEIHASDLSPEDYLPCTVAGCTMMAKIGPQSRECNRASTLSRGFSSLGDSLECQLRSTEDDCLGLLTATGKVCDWLGDEQLADVIDDDEGGRRRLGVLLASPAPRIKDRITLHGGAPNSTVPFFYPAFCTLRDLATGLQKVMLLKYLEAAMTSAREAGLSAEDISTEVESAECQQFSWNTTQCEAHTTSRGHTCHMCKQLPKELYPYPDAPVSDDGDPRFTQLCLSDESWPNLCAELRTIKCMCNGTRWELAPLPTLAPASSPSFGMNAAVMPTANCQLAVLLAAGGLLGVWVA